MFRGHAFIIVFPASAGVFPKVELIGLDVESIPRIRGGVSAV